MKIHVSALLTAIVVCLACSVSGYAQSYTPAPAPSSAPSTAPSAPPVVHLSDYKFNPNTLTVNVGDTVTFINDDSFTHNVMGDTFQSGDITGGQSWKHTFDTAGTFTYVCTYHPGMKGTIIVAAPKS